MRRALEAIWCPFVNRQEENLSQFNTDNPFLNKNDSPALSAAAISALHQGNKIEAIKIVRVERNIGLKEAKDAVDAFVRSQPALQSTFAAAQSGATRKALAWIVGIVVVALIVYSLR